MRHFSQPMDLSPVELVGIDPNFKNPLFDKVQIKVCYIGEEPNRNGSIITKETALDMAQSLRGCPIVGHYIESKEDFGEHDRQIDLSNGDFRIVDITKPYGFVDMNAKVWFQKFIDDGINEREYLMTEGYLWTSQYPECKRIIERGNNQSMELAQENLNADWSKDENGNPEFFIINEAIISKLCILGEDQEPCFEGASIEKVQFSFNDGFEERLFSMMNELKEMLKGGASQMFTTYAVTVGDSLWNALYDFASENYSIEAVMEDDEQKFAVLKDADSKYYRVDFSYSDDEGFKAQTEIEAFDSYEPSDEPQFALNDVEEFIENYKKKDTKEDEEEDKSDDSSDSEEVPDEEQSNEDAGKEDEEEKKKKKYSLDEIPEYIELNNNYAQLKADYDALVAEKEAFKVVETTEYVELNSKFEALQTEYNNYKAERENVDAELEALKEFKANADRKEKQEMIDGFYMLSDEDKKDVIDNIDFYSLNDIEAKLSILCVRNRINFGDEPKKETTVYNLNDENQNEDSDTIPAWIKAVKEVSKDM